MSFYRLHRFDTQDALNFELDSVLINPLQGDLITAALRGAHFVIGGEMGSPLIEKMRGWGKEDLSDVNIDQKFGFYSKLEVERKKTADVVKVLSE